MPNSAFGFVITHDGHAILRLFASVPNTRSPSSVHPTREGVRRSPRSSGTTATSRVVPPLRVTATVVVSEPTSTARESALVVWNVLATHNVAIVTNLASNLTLLKHKRAPGFRDETRGATRAIAETP